MCGFVEVCCGELIFSHFVSSQFIVFCLFFLFMHVFFGWCCVVCCGGVLGGVFFFGVFFLIECCGVILLLCPNCYIICARLEYLDIYQYHFYSLVNSHF